jgi:chromosome segregation ATPase
MLAYVGQFGVLNYWHAGQMAEMDTPIETLHERLTQLLADWGAEMSMVLKELEDARGRIAEFEELSSGSQDELEAMQRRIDGQDSLIETLKADAEEAAGLRKSLVASEKETEKFRAELESKHDLVMALRKEADDLDALEKELKRKNREFEALRAENDRLRQQIVEVEERLAVAEESAAQTHDDTTELVALRAELDAKSSLIKSLHTDAERFVALEITLDEKRETIAKLEASINRQAATIVDLKESVTRWKSKCAALKASGATGDTSISTRLPMPSLAADDLEADALAATDIRAERTIAINMRDSLSEVREALGKEKQKQVAGS